MPAKVFFQSASELATLTNVFEVGGVATDPSTVSLQVTDPTGAITTSTWAASQVTRTGVGAFNMDVACSVAGEWRYLWVGTGTASDAAAGSWTVYEADLGKSYATLDALKSRLGIDLDDTEDDYTLIASAITASRGIEQLCRRTFWRTPAGTSRTFVASDGRFIDLGPWNDLVTVSAIGTDWAGDGTYEVAWSATDYQLYPINAQGPEQRPYTGLRAVGGQLFPIDWAGYGRADRVQVTGIWGWPVVPMAIREAALVLAAEIFKGKDAPFGIVSYGDMGVARVRDNPMVARLANDYRLSPVGVA